MKSIILAAAMALSGFFCLGSSAHATPTFVGSYAVDGNGAAPSWATNPPVYSAREAAALLFGGDADDYLISVNPSLDPLTITLTGHYDGWAENDTIFNQDYRLDTGGHGYNSAPGLGSAWSAYVFDHADSNINYVWRNDAPDVADKNDTDRDDLPADGAPAVPEPGSLGLLGCGLFGLIGRLRQTGKG